MNSHVFRAARVLAPNDLRMIWRDGFLMGFVIFALPLFALAAHDLIPWIAELVAPWVVLEDYYGLIVAAVFIAGQPVLLGFVVGVLFVEERDAGTLLALKASPLSLRSFLAYRLLLAGAANMVLTTVAVVVADLVTVSWLALFACVVLGCLAIPLVVLVYATFVKNKVQALMLAKPVQIWGSLPAFLFFAPTPMDWVGGVIMPLYFPIRLFWEATQGAPEWWLLLPGIAIPVAATVWLFGQFEKRVCR